MDHWGNQRGNIKTPRDKWQWRHDDPKTLGYCKRSSKREVYSNSILTQDTRKIKYNLHLHPKQLEINEQTKLKLTGRKEITKIREEINKIEMKKT